MSPENQWLEDVFPTEIVPVSGDMLVFREGYYPQNESLRKIIQDLGLLGPNFSFTFFNRRLQRKMKSTHLIERMAKITEPPPVAFFVAGLVVGEVYTACGPENSSCFNEVKWDPIGSM